MEWRRGKTTETAAVRNSVTRRERGGIGRLLTVSAVLLALLPALFGAVTPEAVDAQAVPNTMTVASAPGDAWTDGTNSSTAVCASYTSPGGSCSTGPWGSLVPNASWIWKATGTNHPAEQVTFSKSFSLPGDAENISATVYITADNAYELSFNGA
ncbi:MAG TPA: hypothetical protein VGR08_00465, partial [Thermomicrobiales bacterium]|nr:hypothetical protein [Thermomicrobiales bacterium]